MSKYRHNGDKCPHCGVTYGKFRTGMSYNDAFLQLWSMDDNPDTWRYKRRRTVLGYFFMLKQKAWKDHISVCKDEFEFSFVDELKEETTQPQQQCLELSDIPF